MAKKSQKEGENDDILHFVCIKHINILIKKLYIFFISDKNDFCLLFGFIQ